MSEFISNLLWTLKSLDGAHEDSDEVSGVLSGGEVGLVGPVGAHGSDVGSDGLLVQHVVLGDSRGKSRGALEDLSPGLNGGDVVAHSLARSNVFLEVGDEGLDLLDGVKDVEGLDVGEGSLKEAKEGGHALVARLHLSKVVVSHHTINEASHHLGQHQEIHFQLA